MTSLTIPQGTDGGFAWVVNDGDTDDPWDFTNWTVRAQVRRSVGSGTVLHEWSTARGNATADAEGTLTLTWSAAVTSAWDFDAAAYDLEITSPVDARTIRLDSGRLTISKEITR